MNPSARSSSNLIEQFSRMEFLIIRLDAVSLAYSVYMGIHILRCGQRIVESLNCLLNNAVKDLEKLPNKGDRKSGHVKGIIKGELNEDYTIKRSSIESESNQIAGTND